MALSPTQEWTLVACGLIAHADNILEVGEWDHILRLLGDKVDAEDEDRWLALLSDRAALEEKFSELSPPPPAFNEKLLRQAWRMALSDGSGSPVEAEVHDHIAERLGVSPEQAEHWRAEWNETAAARAELVLGFAAIMANADGRLDSAEAAQYDTLLERMPVTLGRRVELSAKVLDPPRMEEVVAGLVALSRAERLAALQDLAPLVSASARGQRERDAFLELAESIAVPRDDAARMLE